MRFHLDTAKIFIPDETPIMQALARTTHLSFAAHQDDIEVMSVAPILACFQHEEKWFTGVILTDGRGSPRNGIYQKYNDEEMRLVRFKEQRKAAIIGEYAAQIMLDYPSKVVKDGKSTPPIGDIITILKATKPNIVYTHNLADKHDTHIGVALKVIKAIRNLPESERPQKLYGGEAWRSLDWILDRDKVVADLSQQKNLQAALLGVFDSQISGGKNYDLATLARRRANATYFSSHGVDTASGLSFAMDMTPLISGAEKDPALFIEELIQRFADDVNDRLQRIS